MVGKVNAIKKSVRHVKSRVVTKINNGVGNLRSRVRKLVAKPVQKVISVVKSDAPAVAGGSVGDAGSVDVASKKAKVDAGSFEIASKKTKSDDRFEIVDKKASSDDNIVETTSQKAKSDDQVEVFGAKAKSNDNIAAVAPKEAKSDAQPAPRPVSLRTSRGGRRRRVRVTRSKQTSAKSGVYLKVVINALEEAGYEAGDFDFENAFEDLD